MLFDLDDTLVPQAPWLAGAWADVADAAGRLGADRDALYQTLLAVSAEGSDRGGIIDRSLHLCRASVPVAPLVAVFWAHRPDRVDCYPGALAAVRRLARRVPVAVVTDGHVGVQRAKVEAAGLAEVARVVIYSDEWGRDQRKPHPAPFARALAGLGVEPGAAVFVGDRPDKDVAGAQDCGIRAVRVLTGEYAHAPDRPPAWRTVADVAAAVALLEPLLVDGPG